MEFAPHLKRVRAILDGPQLQSVHDVSIILGVMHHTTENLLKVSVS